LLLTNIEPCNAYQVPKNVNWATAMKPVYYMKLLWIITHGIWFLFPLTEKLLSVMDTSS